MGSLMSVGAHIDVMSGKKTARQTVQVLVKVRSVDNRCGVTEIDRVRKKDDMAHTECD